MPTAMPLVPFASGLGNAAGRTWLLVAAVVGGAELDGVGVDAVEQRAQRDLGQAGLGVAHGRGIVAVDIAEIALAVDQRVALRELLREADHGVVDRDLAVQVEFADDRRPPARISCSRLRGRAGA